MRPAAARLVLLVGLTSQTACGMGSRSPSAGTGAGGVSSGTGAGGYQQDGAASDASGGDAPVTGSAGSTGAGGSGSPGTAGASGAAGSPGTGGAVGSGADGGVPPPCSIELLRASPPAGVDLEAGPLAIVRIEARVSGNVVEEKAWAWQVSLAEEPVVFTSSPNVVEFPAAVLGVYKVVFSAGPHCTKSLVIEAIKPKPQSFTFRAMPPPSSGLPTQDLRVELKPDGPSPTTLALTAGEPVSISPYDDSGQPLPAYVRVTSPTFGFTLEGHTSSGPLLVSLVEQITYDVLIVPDAALAPVVVSGTAPTLRTFSSVDPGVPATGHVLDGQGRPMAGARLVLHSGTRPSTVGVTDATGAFQVWTRAGTLSAVIVPPADSGLPDAHVGASNAVVLASSDTSLEVEVRWADAVTAPLSVTVHAASGQVMAGAGVQVDATADLRDVATVRARPSSVAAGDVVTQPAVGTVHVEAVTDGLGAVRFPALVTGSYRVTVVPPDGAPDDAVTTAAVELVAPGVNAVVSVRKKVLVSGVLVPALETKGVKVTAVDNTVSTAGAAISTTAGEGGQFQLALAPGRTYQLWATPLPGQMLGRAWLGTTVVDAANPGVGNLTVPPGVAFVGAVNSFGVGVGDVLIRVFCAGPFPGCRDPSAPLAEAVSRWDGSFSLMLPGRRPL